MSFHKCMLALCPRGYKEGLRSGLGDPVEVQPDGATDETTTCSPTKDGPKEGEAAPAQGGPNEGSPKKRSLPRNCNTPEKEKSPQSKRFKVHQ